MEPGPLLLGRRQQAPRGLERHGNPLGEPGFRGVLRTLGGWGRDRESALYRC